MHVNIKIAAVGDPPTFPELVPCTEAHLVGVSILQAGMESGRTSLALHAVAGQRYYTIQLSADMLLAIAGAVRGAQERFGDNQSPIANDQ